MPNGKKELGRSRRPVGGKFYSEMEKGLSATARAGIVGAMERKTAGPVGESGKALSDHEQRTIRQLLSSESGKALSDGDQRRLESILTSGRVPSDADRRLISRVTSVLRQVGPGGRAASGRDQWIEDKIAEYPKKRPGGRTTSDIGLPGGRTTSDRLRKKGGSVKKYAKGGGVRKARYK
jgi:hypothetical protein